jgi:hypothetical protein
VVDSLLRSAESVSGAEVDALLDFRSLLHRSEDAEAIVNLFCELRRSLEGRHYLAFYRLRRWLENHIQANVRLCRGRPEQIVPLKLDRYCLEAVRYQCLKTAALNGHLILAPRVSFSFRHSTQDQGSTESRPTSVLQVG